MPPTSTLSWIDATAEQPDSARCVLVCDDEVYHVACWENGEWWDAHADQVIDSFVRYWAELPEIPDI